MYEALIVIVFQTNKKQTKQNRVTTIFKDTNFGKLTYPQLSIIYIPIQDRVFLLLLLIFCGSLRSVNILLKVQKSQGLGLSAPMLVTLSPIDSWQLFILGIGTPIAVLPWEWVLSWRIITSCRGWLPLPRPRDYHPWERIIISLCCIILALDQHVMSAILRLECLIPYPFTTQSVFIFLS